MSLEEVAQVQDDFAAAARRAREAGLDMVEILGSAGYLICQFLSPAINQREDQYGGSLDNRMRFGLETIAKVRAAVGEDFCVGIRIAGNDFVPGSHTGEEAALFAQACEKGRGGPDQCHRRVARDPGAPDHPGTASRRLQLPGPGGQVGGGQGARGRQQPASIARSWPRPSWPGATRTSSAWGGPCWPTPSCR